MATEPTLELVLQDLVTAYETLPNGLGDYHFDMTQGQILREMRPYEGLNLHNAGQTNLWVMVTEGALATEHLPSEIRAYSLLVEHMIVMKFEESIDDSANQIGFTPARAMNRAAADIVRASQQDPTRGNIRSYSTELVSIVPVAGIFVPWHARELTIEIKYKLDIVNL